MTEDEKSALYKKIVEAHQKIAKARTSGPLWMIYEGVMYVRESDQDEWRVKEEE